MSKHIDPRFVPVDEIPDVVELVLLVRYDVQIAYDDFPTESYRNVHHIPHLCSTLELMVGGLLRLMIY